ncbi:MAG: hypothetical protein KC433_22885 [Anaerolineales bacterium]|nr:hypothetical protein [Anaerolineales bacterium]MCB8937160.1 hypothetical protein [Ardenticatenaceae bacterium]
MNTNKKQRKGSFWLVFVGLLLLIGFISGGVYLLDDQGLISLGGEMDGERPSLPEMSTTADGDTFQPPTRDFEEAGGFNSFSLLGILKTVVQLGIVVIAVTGFQRLANQRANQRGRATPIKIGDDRCLP